MPTESSDHGLSGGRLEQLATVMLACRETHLQISKEFHWHPGPGSRAAADAEVLAAVDSNPNEDGIFAGPVLLSEVVATYLDIAAGHLAGMAAVYRACEVFFAPVPLARSTMETAARVFWVIGAPGDTAEMRLARAYLEEFLSCELAKRAARYLGGKDDPTYQAAEQRWKAVRARIMATFPGTTKEMLGRAKGRECAGQVQPGPEGGVIAMYALLRAHRATSLDEEQVHGSYDFLSSGTHPTLYQARQMREYREHEDHFGTQIATDIKFLDNLCRIAVLSFYQALSLTVGYFGAPVATFDALAALIDQVLPGALRAEPMEP
jgi:hypothetical protein